MRKSCMKLCSIVLICVLLLNVLCSATEVYAEETRMYGDVSQDGAVNAYDALLVLYLAASMMYTPEQEALMDAADYSLGDVSGEGDVNAVDALYILKYAANIIDEFPIAERYTDVKVEDLKAIVLENIENEVVLGEYKGIEVEVEKLVVTDADIQYYIDLALEMAGLSELTDEFVASMEIDGVSTVEEFKAYLMDVLEAQMGDYQKYYEVEVVFSEILADSRVLAYNDPELNVDEMCEEIIAATKESAEMIGVSYEEYVSTYLEMSVEDYEAELRLEYELYVDFVLVMRAIAKAENIEVSQEEFEAAYAEQIADYELLGYESVEEYAKAIYEELLYTKVQDMVMESAVVSYK